MSALPNARSLFAAAREDGPDAAERTAVFRRIGLATGIATGAAAAATVLSIVPAASVAATAASATSATVGAAEAVTVAKAAVTGGMFGMKLLALGAMLGAASMALGIILAVTVVVPDASGVGGRTTTVAATASPAAIGTGARLAQPVTRRRDTSVADAKASAPEPKADMDANANASAKASANGSTDPNAEANAKASGGASDLGEEARLVTAARTALMAGDPARALSLVQATRKLGARSLEPEELGLEARALRALGRADDAAATELVLRRRYPDHALAR